MNTGLSHYVRTVNARRVPDQTGPRLLFVLTGQVISVPSSVCYASNISTTENVVCWMCWIPQFLCTFPQGLTCTLVHMNTLQRAWIFHGWCKNAFSGRFLMWLLERAPLTLQRYLLWALPSPSLLKRVMAVATPSVGIVPCFLIEFQILGGNFISFFCTRRWVGLQLGNKRQTHTPTFLPTEPC